MGCTIGEAVGKLEGADSIADTPNGIIAAVMVWTFLYGVRKPFSPKVSRGRRILLKM
jgi:hypothetical protein